MPAKNPSQRKNELIANKRNELLKLGYKTGIIDVAMEWAVGNAEGIAKRAHQDVDEDPSSVDLDKLTVNFLPFYLARIERYIHSFGHDRGETEVSR